MTQNENITHNFSVKAKQNKARLDKYLSLQDTKLTRNRIKHLIEAQHVSVNDIIVTAPAQKVKTDDIITITIPPLEETHITAQNIPINIVYEDEDLIVINKQAGLTVHPGAGNHDNTLVNALLYHCGDTLSGIGGVQRPGIVHRLDKDTSGLMVVAKNDITHLNLSEQLQERSLKRKYYCFTWGAPFPPSGTIETYIGRHPQHRTKMSISGEAGRHSVTHYNVIETFADKQFALIECQLETGRTHQIRVHMQHLGFPLIGDPLYGSRHLNFKKNNFDEESKLFIKKFTRQALHSKYMRFTHPKLQTELEFHADLDEHKPEDMYELYRCLKNL